MLMILFSLYTNIWGDDITLSELKLREPLDKKIRIKEDKHLDSLFSQKKLGSFVQNNVTYFRLFAPNAIKVVLVTLSKPTDLNLNYYEMKRDEEGVWEAVLEGERYGLFYGYKVYSAGNGHEPLPICIDPYSKAVASFTTFLNPRMSIVYKDNYDWEDDTWIKRDWLDHIIYEMHIKDITAHPSSGANSLGTYKGLIEKDICGGINYIKSLGVNTVELLPAQEFGYYEIPYLDSLNGFFNTWNPYERNHWGYMTAAFFAPTAYYCYPRGSIKDSVWIGTSGEQVKQFKDMVKAFHKEGIAVIMDVVYNHLSQYEVGNLKQIDKEYYFRIDEEGNLIAQSGCGNDLKTERPMLRRLIVESILYWMTEYHIDGFRFDLGKLIDWETVEEIIREAKLINPDVIIVCEPWGGGYDPTGFSERGWSAWNDQIRNGIKGENPRNGHGWLFGKWYGNNNIERIKSYIRGTLTKDEHGLFLDAAHSVNYLESHDGYTFGDFIRIGIGEVKENDKISNINEHIKLSPNQLKLNKLGALFLFVSKGITMINSGQEFARSKVIADDPRVNDPNKLKIDHNSYDKDNETNYINFTHAEINSNLLEYYKGLINLRKTYDAFRHCNYEDVNFFDLDEEFGLAFSIIYKGNSFIVIMNAEQDKDLNFKLPEGDWSVLVDNNFSGILELREVNSEISIPAISGVVLKRK
ncbi:MAG: pullulanase [Ignavibacteriales bacterium]|nr:pullulanase [Ignavibacteriales bacterium]